MLLGGTGKSLGKKGYTYTILIAMYPHCSICNNYSLHENLTNNMVLMQINKGISADIKNIGVNQREKIISSAHY